MTEPHAGGWLVVRRYSAVVRDPVAPLTHQIVRQRYRGFDGIAWPSETGALALSNGLVPEPFFAEVEQYWRSVGAADVDLIYVAFDLTSSPQTVGVSPMYFCGYDYGNFVSEDNYFSSVLNEVIYGVNEKMTSFVSALNDGLLFESIQTAMAFQSVRRRLSHGGGALESEEPGEEFQPIAVFAPT